MKKFQKSVLCFTGFYLPGFKGGGPIRTIANVVEALGRDISISIVTLDRDLGDNNSYPNITPDKWQKVGNANVFYISQNNIFIKIFTVIKNFQGDFLHLNSFFSFKFSILPLTIASIIKPNAKIIIGPRGEFSHEALKIKSFKKQCYLLLAKLFKIHKNVIWHASTIHEASDIRRVMGSTVKIRTAIDIAAPKENLTLSPRVDNSPINIVFISRISPMKNLLGAIESLKHVKHPVNFHVYGPTEDMKYWNTCQNAAINLPSNVNFDYHGFLLPSEVAEKIAEYDMFFLPTLGENFGHVIAEALSSGLPVLISNNTPWRDLEGKELGWDLPLDQPDLFARRIDYCYTMPASEFNRWRKNIRSWALENIGNKEAIEQNRQLFTN